MRDQGISCTRTHEHSTTAAPYCSSKSLSAGDKTRFAFGLRGLSITSTQLWEGVEVGTYEMTTPGYFWPMGSSRIMPKCMSRFPLHLFESQWPKSQHAALKGGRSLAPPSSPPGPVERAVCRGFVENFFALADELSFLWRTMFLGTCDRDVLDGERRGSRCQDEVVIMGMSFLHDLSERRIFAIRLRKDLYRHVSCRGFPAIVRRIRRTILWSEIWHGRASHLLLLTTRKIHNGSRCASSRPRRGCGGGAKSL